jgi:hypothetical protein
MPASEAIKDDIPACGAAQGAAGVSHVEDFLEDLSQISLANKWSVAIKKFECILIKNKYSID